MASAAQSELRNANSARTASDHGRSPALARPIAIENTTKLAPIRIEAFWSAICDSCSVLFCAVRSACIALTEKDETAGPGAGTRPGVAAGCSTFGSRAPQLRACHRLRRLTSGAPGRLSAALAWQAWPAAADGGALWTP